MKNYHPHTIIYLLFFLTHTSCNAQQTSNSNVNQPANEAKSDTSLQIDQYVVDVFEDKKGNLWFGTLSKGAAIFDGKTLSYFSTKDGLPGNTVVTFAEDRQGNIWIGTHEGLSRYDGKTFINFTKKDGLCHDRVSSLLIDKSGRLWIGTWGGVCCYDGTTFTNFPLPKPDINLQSYQSTMDWVTEMIEDRQGNIWFCRDGYGACRYDTSTKLSTDGKSFTHFTKKNGLASNNVQAIQEDKNGNIWFGSRITENDHPDSTKRSGDGGLSRYDGKTIIQYPGIKGLSKNEIYAIGADKKGNIWIGANKVGVYRYDGQDFILFSETDRVDLLTYGYGIQSILEDTRGNLWFGLSGGLFRLKGTTITHVSQKGSWD